MNPNRAQALARLRAADPATADPATADPATDGIDPNAPQARAMLERVLMAREEHRPAPARGRRRLAIGLAGATVVAAVSTIAVFEPWSVIDPASAYAVDKKSDGSLAVTFSAARLQDTRRLNAELARQGARTTVMAMVPADRCATQPAVDPRFELRPGLPVDYEQARDGSIVIVIKPSTIPAGDQLVIGYAITKHREDRTTMVRPLVVTSVPTCLAIPARPLR